MHSTNPPFDPKSAPVASDVSVTRHLLGLLFVLVALNALSGGFYGILGASGIPRGWLVGSPFESYLVPGGLLLVVVGGSSLGASALVVSGARHSAVGAVAASLVLLGWVAAQHPVIGHVAWFQSMVAGVAVLELLLALRLAVEEHGGR